MRVKDAMTRPAISVLPQASVSEALEKMTRSRFSGLPVIDEAGSLVGIVSESDFLRRWELRTESSPLHWLEEFILLEKTAEIYTRTHARRIEEIMSREVATVDENASLGEAVRLMEHRRVKRLPVVKEVPSGSDGRNARGRPTRPNLRAGGPGSDSIDRCQ